MKDVKINITKSDKSLLDNLIRMLGRAKMELEGVEILVAADSMRWLSRLQKSIEEEYKRPPVEIVKQEPIKTKPKRSKKAE
jgi:hypothetical protein